MTSRFPLRFRVRASLVAFAVNAVLAVAAAAQCTISGPTTSCGPAELCGPEGQGVYYWAPPGGGVQNTRCITATESGVYSLRTGATFDTMGEPCWISVTITDPSACGPIVNCPRPATYWKASCPVTSGAATTLSSSQLGDVAAGVDTRSTLFNWTGSQLDGLCAALTPDPFNARASARRQHAAFLANLWAGEMRLVTASGEKPALDPATLVGWDGYTISLGDLATRIDARLVELEGMNQSLLTTRLRYTVIALVLEAINNGKGIGAVCGQTAVARTASEPTREDLEAAIGAPQTTGSLELSRAYPNPAAGPLTVDFAIGGAGANVKIAVYDVAGRQVRELVNGFQTAGTHSVRWDGTDAGGSRARAGVYFLRGLVDGRSVATRTVQLVN